LRQQQQAPEDMRVTAEMAIQASSVLDRRRTVWASWLVAAVSTAL